MMGLDYSAALSRAWKYSTTQRILGIFTGVYLAGAALVGIPLLLIIASGLGSVEKILSSVVWLFVSIIIGSVIVMYTSLLFTHNYAVKGKLSSSSQATKARMGTFVIASLMAGIISFFANVVPVFGILLSLIIGMVLFFYVQEIILNKAGATDSLKNSYTIFKVWWADVLLTTIITLVLGLTILLIFALPMIVVFISALATGINSGFAIAMLANLPMLAVTGIILVFGIAFTTLFTNSFKTDIYMQIKRTKSKTAR